MYKIIKLTLWENVYHYEIIDENESKIMYTAKNNCKTLRELITNFVISDKNYKVTSFNRTLFRYEIVDTLESLDLDYIKNKYIHYLI